MKQFLVLLVAGMSSRFKATYPKQFAVVGPRGETLIEYSVRQALQFFPYDAIIFVTNPKTRKLYQDRFDSVYRQKEVYYTDQVYDTDKRERPWGTTDAICTLLPFATSNPNAHFTILNGDDIYGLTSFQKLHERWTSAPQNLIGGLPVRSTLMSDAVVNRGIISTDAKNQVTFIREHTGISLRDETLLDMTANVNFLFFDARVILSLCELLVKFKEEHKEDARIECFITSSLNELIADGKLELFCLPLDEKVLGLTFYEDIGPLRQRLAEKKKLN